TGIVHVPVSSISSLTVSLGNLGDHMTLLSSGAGVPIAVNLGGDTDTMDIGQAGNGQLDPIGGKVTVNGDSADTLNVNDQATNSASTAWSITNSLVGRVHQSINGLTRTTLGAETIKYSGVGNLNVQGAAVGDFINFYSSSAKTNIFGNEGADFISMGTN